MTFSEGVAVVVLVVWIGASARALITADYKGMEIVTPIVMMIVAALYGTSLLRQNRNGDEPK